MAGINKNPYRVLRRPVITEKSASSSGDDSSGKTFVFEVCSKASKTNIKKAVEKVFEVEVKSVRTLNVAGKVKKVGMRTGKQRDYKKAYVSLKPGHDIEIVEGL